MGENVLDPSLYVFTKNYRAYPKKEYYKGMLKGLAKEFQVPVEYISFDNDLATIPSITYVPVNSFFDSIRKGREKSVSQNKLRKAQMVKLSKICNKRIKKGTLVYQLLLYKILCKL